MSDLAPQMAAFEEVLREDRDVLRPIDDDPFRTATYLRGFHNGMMEAAKVVDDRGKRYKKSGTNIGPIQSRAANSIAFYIRKAAKKITP